MSADAQGGGPRASADQVGQGHPGGKIERKVALKGIGATKGAKAAIEAAGGSVA